ncbi:Cys-tRNA(Pro)/Cys-tRNA(Cys) deacylase [Nocardioides daedukensis]|uniref:Cys-tRNA(Pro)/Cys-tRNA(Cys) deacylase n=1 Tax=Nocardioides daedukensis TaxID=634462 RepID=A0A7Y9UPW2_9ACTN|nr:Cys-tRNA(Pro) deacylase [Nocardioides daedukensis]NYG57956.1 Cys-tRNA(Pro)/Cys-tRNA(Cys) deacylase [Nocardioides daedukensis]
MAKRSGPRAGSAGTPATVALGAAGVEFTAHPYEHDPRAASYGLEAAELLGLEPAQVFKTLLADTGAQLVVGIVPVTGQLDLKALARAVGASRCTMADPAAAQRATGYVVGGISPVGQKKTHPTVLDASALEHSVVYVSGGRRGLDLGLAPADLVRVTGAITARIGR